MKAIAILITLLLTIINYSIHAQNNSNEQTQYKNTIQLALLLDVSGSMEGLIEQAKTQLWTVVNEIAKAKKNGQNAKLEIAIYEYGRQTLPAQTGYIRKLLDYTSDLDSVSTVLFSLKTDGTLEYCGMVLEKALSELQWRAQDSIYKVIFIAGNEEFNQGSTDFRKVTINAAELGIVINTIHCGDSFTGVQHLWKEAARGGKGEYFFINQNSRAHDIPTPYDSMMGVYNDSLNTTYLNYGKYGMLNKTNQMVQDNNADLIGKSIKAKRAVTKTKSLYNNKSWDAVDAVKNDTSFISKTKDEDLPIELQGKTKIEKVRVLDSTAKKRLYFSEKINALNVLRELYLIDHKPIETNKVKTLGEALTEAIHMQAEVRGFKFE